MLGTICQQGRAARTIPDAAKPEGQSHTLVAWSRLPPARWGWHLTGQSEIQKERAAAKHWTLQRCILPHSFSLFSFEYLFNMFPFSPIFFLLVHYLFFLSNLIFYSFLVLLHFFFFLPFLTFSLNFIFFPSLPCYYHLLFFLLTLSSQNHFLSFGNLMLFFSVL